MRVKCQNTIISLLPFWLIVVDLSLCRNAVLSSSSHFQLPLKKSFIHKNLTPEERLILLGDSKKVPEYQVISQVDHFIGGIFSKRQKRSTGNEEASSNQPIVVRFEAFGEQFRLRLAPNHHLLAPRFRFTNKWNSSSQPFSLNELWSCFYQGYDEKDPNNSAVALTLCNGMQGVIESKGSIYVVNPIPDSTLQRLLELNKTSTSIYPKYHVITRKNDFNQYECPHHRGQDDKRRLAIIDHLSILNRTKRSIDVVASNLNFLEADRLKKPSPPPSTASENEIDSVATRNKTSSTAAAHFNITVETAVFVDESLYKLLSKTFPVDSEQQIVLYALTIMNAVQLLFKQPSIGRSVDVSVVLMDLLKQQPENLTPSDNIDTYLTNFCVWQHKKRLRESGGPTPDWDHALLLSGINMYVVDGFGRRKRHVVGLAPVSGMCNSLNSCTISEGSSFQTVLVAGHEMGHSLGMEHDGTQDGNQCNKDDFVMSPTLGPGKTTWSHCSQHYLDKFVLTPQATCVIGRSSHVNIIEQFIPKNQLPGERFTVDDQCRFRFGPTARHFKSQPKNEVCRVIKCHVKSSAISKHGFLSGRALYHHYPSKSTYNTHPALEGSECGFKKWCREGDCIAKTNQISLSANYNVPSLSNKSAIVVVSHSDEKTSSPTPLKSTVKPKTIIIKSDNKKYKNPYHFKLDRNMNNSIDLLNPYNDSSVLLVSAQPNPYNEKSILDDWIIKKNSINGNWSQWSHYGPCVSECVASSDQRIPLGVQTSFRRCDNPSPSHGGQVCSGPDKKIKLCNAVEVCSAASATSAASASPNSAASLLRSKLDGSLLGQRYQIRSVNEYIEDTCRAASIFNEKVEQYGTQYPNFDCKGLGCCTRRLVWCYKRGGGLMSQGWRLPDGTPCGRKSVTLSGLDSVHLTGFCYDGQCRSFDCHTEVFVRSSIDVNTASNVYSAPSTFESDHLVHSLINHDAECPENFSINDAIQQVEAASSQTSEFSNKNYDSTYQLVKVNNKGNESVWRISPKITPNVVGASLKKNVFASNWSDWNAVTECQYSIACIEAGRGFRLVTRECHANALCIGRREALQLCYEGEDKRSVSYGLYQQYCPIEKQLTSDQYASRLCRKYQIKYPSLLSGNGRQLLSATTNKNSGCIVACEDRIWNDIHYQMDAFEDGKFPFGTDCSVTGRPGYCLNGKCINFDSKGISYDSAESVLYRSEILQLFGPVTSLPSFGLDMLTITADGSNFSPTTDSLYSVLLNEAFYKRASTTTPIDQPALKSFLSSQKVVRMKRATQQKKTAHNHKPPANSMLYRKAFVQENIDPEEDYVSWVLLRHHHHYRRPITRTIKPMASRVDWTIPGAFVLKKPSKPIKLTLVGRQQQELDSRSKNIRNSHFETFMLVKPTRKNLPKTSTNFFPDVKSSSTPMMRNETKFLDDDDDDEEEEEEEEKEGEKEEEEEQSGVKQIKLNNQTKSRQMNRNFGLGHESWPSPPPNHHKFSSENNGEEVRVEPYVWSIILSECSKSCGKGERTVRVVCTQGQQTVVEQYCDVHSKPQHNFIEQCKERDCIGRWRAEEWSDCNSQMGLCQQSRTIFCVGPAFGRNQTNSVDQQNARLFSLLSPAFCDESSKPMQHRPCFQTKECSV